MEALAEKTYPGYGHVAGRRMGIFRTVESGLPLLPEKVLALSKDGALLMSDVYKREGRFFCKQGIQILQNVTHYALINDILMTDEFKSLLPK